MSSRISWSIFIILMAICYGEEKDLGLNPVYDGLKYIKLGSPIVISCKFNELQTLKWMVHNFTDNTSRKAAGTYDESPIGGIEKVVYLRIAQATSKDAGNYTCHDNSKTSHEIIIINEILTNYNYVDGIYVITLHNKFELQCNITTTPEDAEPIGFLWFLNDEQIIQSKRVKFTSNNKLFIKDALETDCGSYSCKLNVSDLDYNNTIFVQSKPFITGNWGLVPSTNKVEGEDISIDCVVKGAPTPQIYWSKDGLNISDSNNTRYDIKGNETWSSLTISNLEESDRANYTCTAINPYGEATVWLFVRVKDKLAALWPFLGIIAEVAVLCTIIFIYEKRRAKQEFDESDTDQSPDTKNVSEDKDTDVRQRKGN